MVSPDRTQVIWFEEFSLTSWTQHAEQNSVVTTLNNKDSSIYFSDILRKIWDLFSVKPELCHVFFDSVLHCDGEVLEQFEGGMISNPKLENFRQNTQHVWRQSFPPVSRTNSSIKTWIAANRWAVWPFVVFAVWYKMVLLWISVRNTRFTVASVVVWVA